MGCNSKLIRGILDLFIKRSYIAVTATPFANIFILPEKTDQMENEDLFPADYIYAMEPPSNYIGGNEIFGDEARFESALVRIDDADDYFPYKHKQDIYLDSLPESLYEALSYFVLAKDDIEIVCRCAFEEDSPLLAVSDAIGYQELVEMDCYDVALLIKNYAEQKYGIRLQFAPLTLEIVVDK